MEKKENLASEENGELKEKCLEFLRRYSGDSNDLQIYREEALKAYRRDPYKEDAGIPDGSRSKFIMSDVADTIEWIIPSLMRIFYSGKEVVKIEGSGPEDDKGAELLNAKVNWDITRQNNGFLLFHDWFKASMLNKFSVVKYWWDSHDETKVEKYQGLSDEAFQQLIADENYSVMKHSEKPARASGVIQQEIKIDDPAVGPVVLQPKTSEHTVEGRRIVRKVRRPVAEVVPPEEFICSLSMRNIKDEEFVAHRKRIHKFALMREYDLDEDDLKADSEMFTNQDAEIWERFKDLGGMQFFSDQDDKDYYFIYECYLKNESKESSDNLILTILGDRLIRKQTNYKSAGFCLNSPIRMPHRAIGMSIYDQVVDLQKLRSSLARFILNNIYYQTDGMLVINPWKINAADFVTQRRPGGIIRTKEDTSPADAIFPVPVQPLAGHAFGLLESVDSWKEKRTGVTSYNQGTNADTLNKTARGISEIMAASQQRIELIARVYAETGVRDLMIAFAEMNIENLDETTNIRLNEGWKEIDPSKIDVLFDCTIDVALGTGSKELKVQQLGGMVDRSMNPTLISSGIVQPINVYNLLKSLYVEMGYKNYEQFVTNPEQLQPGGPSVAGIQGNVGAEGTGVPAGSSMVPGSAPNPGGAPSATVF